MKISPPLRAVLTFIGIWALYFAFWFVSARFTGQPFPENAVRAVPLACWAAVAAVSAIEVFKNADRK